MKMSKREKLLLFIALSLLIIFLLNKFVINAQIDKIAMVKKDAISLKAKVGDSENTLLALAHVDDQIESKNKEIEEISKLYFENIEQEMAIWVISNAAKEANLSLKALGFNKEKQLDESIDVNFLRVEVPFIGDYFEVVQFLETLKNNEKNIIIEKLNMEINEVKKLEGVAVLGFYSLDNIKRNPKIDSSELDLTKKNDPFKPFDALSEDGLNQMVPEGFDINNISIVPIESKIILEDFEKADVKAVMGDTKGKCSFELDQNATSGTQSLGINYNFPLESMNRTFVVNLEKERINITKPAEKYRLNVYSYSENDIEISLRFLGSDNRIYENILTSDINWIGWKTLEISIDKKYSIYPLRVQGIQIKLGDSAVGSGELLVDSLVAVHAKPSIESNEEELNSQYTSYTVQKGDTLSSISRKFNGSDDFIKRIKSLNHLNSNQINIGKKLLIPTPSVGQIVLDQNLNIEVNGSKPSVIPQLPSAKASETSLEAAEANQKIMKDLAKKINEGDGITTSQEKQEEVINEILSDFMESQNN